VDAIELDESLETVSQAISKSPRVLILGQRYLGTGSVENPRFAAVSTAFGIDKAPEEWWFDQVGDVNARAKLLRGVEDAVTPRQEVIDVLRLNWTAVFTSAMDSTTRRLLRIPDNREVHQIFQPASERANAGSLPVFRLFGSLDRSDPEELPPANSENELRRRRRIASNILDYVPEIVAGGYAFIEGWQPGSDWLRPRDLSQALVPLGKGQVFLFGATESVLDELNRDEDFNHLVVSGVVILVRASLIDTVSTLRKTGQLNVGEEPSANITQVFYPVVKSKPTNGTAPSPQELTTAVFPRLEWRRISDGETIFIDLDPTKPLPNSPTGVQEAFRAFARGEVNWEWLDHLALRRPVLNNLVENCRTVLKSPNPEEHTIVVYGQSGSGKSLILRLLALELRRMGLPVIFSGPSILPINREHIEAFCQAISSVSSAPVFFINDATRDDAEYLELSSYMASRARSCVIVGSSYPAQKVSRRTARGAPTIHRINLPVTLSPSEGEQLLSHLARFISDEKDADILSRFLGQDVSNFFALVYRLLPESRPRGRKGIVSEITESSRKLQERLEEVSRGPAKPNLTTMGVALRKALGEFLAEDVQEAVEEQNGQQSSDNVSDALRLINAVMVVSQLGLQVPQSLALRLIGYNIPAYRISVDGDILQVCEVREGVVTLQARHSLEASIWVSERINKIEDQFALVQQLVKQIRKSEVQNNQAIELEFVAQVLRALGPQGQERFRRPQLYLEIAALVAELRALHEDVHPRLLLIESNAIREGIKNEQSKGLQTLSLDERRLRLKDGLEKLASAEQGLRIAQEIVSKPIDGMLTQGARRMLATLATERAGVIGFMIGSLARSLPAEVYQKPEWTARADQWLRDARTSWREALAFDDSSHQAIDSACWIYAERYKVGGLSIEQEADLFADWSEMIERYKEQELPLFQLNVRDEREAELANCLGDIRRFEAVLKRASERGSNAIHALKARWLEKDEGAVAARKYLEDSCNAERFLTTDGGADAASDRAVLLLYSRLWWQTETGYDNYFPKERICLQFTVEQWRQLLNLSLARLSLEGEEEHPTPLFFRACALFHLGKTEEGEQIFDHLDRLGVGGRRRSRALILMTDESGKPRQLTGEFQGRRRGSWYLAWCDDLRTNVPFNPIELIGPGDVKTGRQIGPFHLSFRFRGAYAEPLHRLDWSRRTSERSSS
jgi:hypothetical protein